MGYAGKENHDSTRYLQPVLIDTERRNALMDAFQTSVGYRSLFILTYPPEKQDVQNLSEDALLQLSRDLFDGLLAEALRSTGEWHWELAIREVIEQVAEDLSFQDHAVYEKLTRALQDWYQTSYRVPSTKEFEEYAAGSWFPPKTRVIELKIPAQDIPAVWASASRYIYDLRADVGRWVSSEDDLFLRWQRDHENALLNLFDVGLLPGPALAAAAAQGIHMPYWRDSLRKLSGWVICQAYLEQGDAGPWRVIRTQVVYTQDSSPASREAPLQGGS